MTPTLTVNPRVQEIIQKALRDSRAFWLGIAPWPRQQVFFELVDTQRYTNINTIQLTALETVTLVEADLSMTRDGEPFIRGIVNSLRQYGTIVGPGETVWFQPGAVEYKGDLP
jgi:hypothetical protein